MGIKFGGIATLEQRNNKLLMYLVEVTRSNILKKAAILLFLLCFTLKLSN